MDTNQPCHDDPYLFWCKHCQNLTQLVPKTRCLRITRRRDSVNSFWYVCDGEVAVFSGQDVNWNNSVIVFATSPEWALIKVMKYHLGMLERVEVMHGGKTIEVIS